ncbi:unnamed protein product [Diamesa tonsa]
MGKIILLDIEGTTTSITFVKDILFPYVREECFNFLNSTWEEASTITAVSMLIKLAYEDKREIAIAEKSKLIPKIVNYVFWQMDLDRKSTELKQLQGLIWQKGYEDSILKGHVYDDVARNFEEWTTLGHKLYIYSSGSVAAQKLLFQYSTAGDLQKYITGYYDTRIGPKTSEQSYINILNDIGARADEVLFLSDMAPELQAAQNVEINVILLDRKDSPPLSLDARKRFKVLQTFDEINF